LKNKILDHTLTLFSLGFLGLLRPGGIKLSPLHGGNMKLGRNVVIDKIFQLKKN